MMYLFIPNIDKPLGKYKAYKIEEDAAYYIIPEWLIKQVTDIKGNLDVRIQIKIPFIDMVKKQTAKLNFGVIHHILQNGVLLHPKNKPRGHKINI